MGDFISEAEERFFEALLSSVSPPLSSSRFFDALPLSKDGSTIRDAGRRTPDGSSRSPPITKHRSCLNKWSPYFSRSQEHSLRHSVAQLHCHPVMVLYGISFLLFLSKDPDAGSGSGMTGRGRHSVNAPALSSRNDSIRDLVITRPYTPHPFSVLFHPPITNHQTPATKHLS